MKIIFITLYLLISFTASAQKGFEELLASNDSTYGFSPENPLKMKKGNRGKSINYSQQFLKSLRTTDDQNLEYIQRFTTHNPGYKSEGVKLTNRYTGMPLNGKSAVLDKYVFLTAVSQDTVLIYVDIYTKGELKIPTGMKMNKTQQ